MTFSELVQPALEGRELPTSHAQLLMEHLMSGEATDAQIGGFLLAMRVKGITAGELATFVRVMRTKATNLDHPFEDLIDTCGTGGGQQTFNLSTAAAIVVSAVGVRVAKHGNRSITGQGSADVLEALGVMVTSDPELLNRSLENHRFAFLFAPAHHPAMKHVANARKELGTRTVFNLLGPLSNPAGAKRQLVGVYDLQYMETMAKAMVDLGCERALLVHSFEGLDEISPSGPTNAILISDGCLTTEQLTPESFGLQPLNPAALGPGSNVMEGAEIVREALTDIDSPRAKAILPNAAAAVWLAGLETTLPAAAARCMEAIASGSAAAKLEEVTAA